MQIFFGTPQRVVDIMSLEDSLLRLVSETITTTTDLSLDVVGAVRRMSQPLSRVVEEYSRSLASLCIVNVYEEQLNGQPVR